MSAQLQSRMDDQRTDLQNGNGAGLKCCSHRFGVLDCIVPIIIGILCADDVGNFSLRKLGIEATGLACFVATIFAGAILGLLACAVWMRLKRWRSTNDIEETKYRSFDNRPSLGSKKP